MATQKDIQGETLNLQVTVEPGCQVKLAVEVKPVATEKAYQEAIKRVNKEVSVPGFRKGKAPIAVIEQKFSHAINDEFRDLVVQNSFTQALKLAEVWPLNNTSVKPPKVEQCDRANGAQVTYHFEALPQSPQIEIEQLTIPTVQPEAVTQERINQAIDELKDVYTSWVEAEGRAVQQGDRVKIDIVKTGAEEETFAEDMAFQVKDGKMARWMQKLLIGKNVGESVEGRSEFEQENTSITADEFEPIDVRLTVKVVETAQRPASEEELAKLMQQGTVDEMHSKLRKDLEQRSANSARARAMQDLHKQLLETYQFELPSSLVSMEQQARMHNLIRAMKDEGFSDDNIKEQQAALSGRVADEADACLRLFFLLRPIAGKAKIDVSQQELVREFSMQMYNIPMSDRIIHDGMEPEAIRTRLYIELLNHKTLDYLIARETKGS